MGRLFWKFLLSYWAALLVALLGVTATLWLYELTYRGWDRQLSKGPHAALQLDAAAATLGHGGIQATRDFLESLRRRGAGSVLVVDSAGHDMLGRPVAPAVLERARALAAAGQESDTVRRVRASDGPTYLIYVPVASAPWPWRVLSPGGAATTLAAAGSGPCREPRLRDAPRLVRRAADPASARRLHGVVGRRPRDPRGPADREPARRGR